MTPLPTGLDLDPENAGTLLETDDKARYHSAVGGIMYAATHTRPDLAYAASLLSRFVAQPQKGHDRALQHVLRYIKGHTRYGIHYSNVRHNLYGYTDSDHGGTVHKEGRRSSLINIWVHILAGKRSNLLVLKASNHRRYINS